MSRNFRANRFQVDWGLEASRPGGKPFGGLVVNVSMSGLRFRCRERFKIGDEVAVELTADPLTRINGTARIVWKLTTTPMEYGAEFRSMEERDREVLTNHLSATLQQAMDGRLLITPPTADRPVMEMTPIPVKPGARLGLRLLKA